MIPLIQAAIVAVFLGTWQMLSPALGLQFFFATPLAVFQSLWALMKSGLLFYHAGITSLEAVAGFLLGGTLGMGIGILLGRHQLLAKVLAPFLTAIYSLPKAALAPLFILWFGIGIDMKIFLAGSIVFFLVFLNTFHGVREVSHEQIAILRLMKANERHLLTKVIIPSAIVWVFAGLRLSVPYALIGAILGEIIAANRGLGFLISSAAGRFDTAGTFAALIAIMFLALVLNRAITFAEGRLMPWRAAEEGREVPI
ncbi:MAG: ABC transporter permease [Alphaproteobacteria bacterium]|nr:ABC transporter permease [Alphaproteobacteria bacterium]